MNYKWSQTGLVDLADKTAASLLVTLLLGAGASVSTSIEFCLLKLIKEFSTGA